MTVIYLKCVIFIDIEQILDRKPEQPDLEAAILDDLNDTEVKVWRDRFGKRLKGPNNTRLHFCTEPQHLIELFYSDDASYLITWGTVLSALENPTPLKRGGKEIADSLRAYIQQESVYQKYIKKTVV